MCLPCALFKTEIPSLSHFWHLKTHLCILLRNTVLHANSGNQLLCYQSKTSKSHANWHVTCRFCLMDKEATSQNLQIGCINKELACGFISQTKKSTPTNYKLHVTFLYEEQNEKPHAQIGHANQGRWLFCNWIKTNKQFEHVNSSSMMDGEKEKNGQRKMPLSSSFGLLFLLCYSILLSNYRKE